MMSVRQFLSAWNRVTPRQSLELIHPLVLNKLLNQGVTPLLVVVSSSLRSDPRFSSLIQRLETQDPGFVQTISVIGLFEQQQERLPPGLLTDFVMSYDELALACSVQRASSAQTSGGSFRCNCSSSNYRTLRCYCGLVDLA